MLFQIEPSQDEWISDLMLQTMSVLIVRQHGKIERFALHTMMTRLGSTSLVGRNIKSALPARLTRQASVNTPLFGLNEKTSVDEHPLVRLKSRMPMACPDLIINFAPLGLNPQTRTPAAARHCAVACSGKPVFERSSASFLIYIFSKVG